MIKPCLNKKRLLIYLKFSSCLKTLLSLEKPWEVLRAKMSDLFKAVLFRITIKYNKNLV